jgi:adenylate kinase family enzyme
VVAVVLAVPLPDFGVVALLAFTDELAAVPRRVLVAGTSGSGKTTMAAKVALVLSVQHVEMDGLYHGPDWTPRASFAGDVARLVAGPAWVTEWQYSSVRPLLARRADLVIWLDVTTLVVMCQVTHRTLRRRYRREVLWNGNVESGLRTILTDRDHIIRWAWRTRHLTAARIDDLLRDRPDLPVVRLRTRREAADWLNGPLRAALHRS